MDRTFICQAQSKQSGLRCRNFVVKGKRVCHIHGGKSTGAKTYEGAQRQKIANWRHGMRSLMASEEACRVSHLARCSKSVINAIEV